MDLIAFSYTCVILIIIGQVISNWWPTKDLVKRWLGCKRYFLVMYIATHPKGQFTGQVTIVSTDGKFFNLDGFKKLVTEVNPELKDIVVTNIIEITTRDDDDYNTDAEQKNNPETHERH